MNYQLIGAIEAGGTKFVCAVAKTPDDLNDPQNRFEFPTGDNPHDTLSKAIAWFRNAEARSSEKIAAIGIASFGPVCLNRNSDKYGFITSTPKPGWTNFNFVNYVQNKFPNKPVGFDTDVNGAALAESFWGAAQGLTDFIYITMGTGIGAGGLVGGQLLHGNVHPEMGHMRIPRVAGDTFPGTCVFHGDCWEGLCSGGAIHNRTGFNAHELPADHNGWEIVCEYTALALANIICILSPQRIIIGGGISKAGPLGRDKFFLEIRRKVRSNLNNYVESPLIQGSDIENYIIPPKLGDNAGVLGAMALGRAELNTFKS